MPKMSIFQILRIESKVKKKNKFVYYYLHIQVFRNICIRYIYVDIIVFS